MEIRESLQRALGSAYTLERELGGGMSRVFLARDVSLHRPVVVKVLPPELAGAVSGDRFQREIRVAAQLQHPHIVPLLSAGQRGELTYYTMPYVEGESLRARLDAAGALPVAQTVRILREVASALAYAHKHGIVHRDIKPDNVLLSDDYAVVTDFGVAKAVSTAARDGSSAITSLGVALGTPAYMAPEQATAEPNVDQRADIYALGVLGYELLTGTAPFAGRPAAAQLAAHVNEMPEALQRRRSNVPEPLAQLIHSCLEKNPADRPQAAEDVVRALDAVATTPAATAPYSAVRGQRKAKLAATGVGLVVFAVFAWMSVTHDSVPPGDPHVVAVFPFRVSSADQGLQYLREGMPDLLGIKLATGAGMRISDVRAVLNAMRQAGGDETRLAPGAYRDLAGSLGAGQTILGEVVGTPTRLVISATLLDLTSDREVRASAEGTAENVPTLVDSLASRLLALRADVPAERMASLSGMPLPALRAYLDGQAFYRRGRYQDAEMAYRRALEVDSTIAPAAFGRAMAMGWLATGPPLNSARRHAWRLRDGLSQVDRLRLEAAVGGRAPGFTPLSEQIAAHERLTTLVPDDVEAWTNLADAYFHFGAAVGYDDALERARLTYAHALTLDSTYLPALEHLHLLYANLGDLTGARRWTKYFLSVDSVSERVGSVQWFEAVLDQDTARMRTLEVTPRSRALILIAAMNEGVGLPDAERRLADARAGAVTAAARRNLASVAWTWSLNAGRPRAAAEASAIVLQDTGAVDSRALRAVFWDGDSAAGAAGAVMNARRARRLAGSSHYAARVVNLAGAALWEVETGRLDRGRPWIAELRTIGALPDSTHHDVASARTLALALETLLAERERRPEADVLLQRLDSVARTGPAVQWVTAVSNLIAARLWERRGNMPLALAAVRRREHEIGYTPTFYSTMLRDEARLAEATGDRDGAIRAYTRYLALRHAPEPEWREDARRAAAALARLRRESASTR